MKAGFLNSLLCILVIILIIPGMIPGIASAVDGTNGSSDSGNSTPDNGSSYTGGSNTTPGNGTSDSTSDNGTSDSNSNKVNSSTSPNNVTSSTTSSTTSKNVTSNTTSSTTSSTTSNKKASSTGNVSSNSSSNSSSSSSYEGMALVSSEPGSNIAAKELSIMNVMAGYPVRFDFVKNVTCITYIEFNPKKTFRQTTTAVEELKNKSALVPTLPPGKIYKNVNIWVGDKGAGLPTSLENGSVDFKVNKTWIEENNVSEAMITLQRYDKEWQPLSTEKVGEDKNYVYFKAKTPGYSFFAITEYTEQNGNSNGIPAEDKITETLKNLGAGNSIIKYPMRAARIIMTISLPLFMIIAGYCVLKKKI
jgi:clumping factor A